MAEIKNLDRLMSKLEKLKDIEFEKAVNDACILVENDAKMRCVVGDSGELRNSITHEIEDKTGYVGSNLKYAPYVEFGTGIFASKGDGRKDAWSYKDAEGNWHTTIGMKPKPYLNPAFENNRTLILEKFEEAIEKGAKDICV